MGMIRPRQRVVGFGLADGYQLEAIRLAMTA